MKNSPTQKSLALLGSVRAGILSALRPALGFGGGACDCQTHDTLALRHASEAERSSFRFLHPSRNVLQINPTSSKI